MNFGIYGAQDGKKLEDSGLEVLDEVASVLEKHPRVPILVDVCLGRETTDQAFWSSCVYYIKRSQSEYVGIVKATESSIPLNSHPFRCSSASQSEEEKLLQAAVVKQELSSRILDAFRNHELGGEEVREKPW